MKTKFALGLAIHLIYFYIQDAQGVAIPAFPPSGFDNNTVNPNFPTDYLRSRRESEPAEEEVSLDDPVAEILPINPTEEPPEEQPESGKDPKPKGPEPSIIELEKSKASFVEAVAKCVPKVSRCLLASIGDLCPLACILDPFTLVKHKIYLIAPLMQSFCMPTNTVFDKDIGLMVDYAGEIKRFSQFVFFTSHIYDIQRFGKLGAEALPFQMVKYGKNPLLDTLKPVAGVMSATLQAVPDLSTDAANFQNSHCEHTDLWAPTLQLVQAFVNNAAAVDLTMPGWFVVMNMFTMNLGRADPHVLAFRKLLTFMLGMECSLVQYSETGAGTDCKLVVGDPKPYPPVQTNNDQDTLCGVLPDIPTIDLHKLLPNLFPLDEINKIVELPADNNVLF